jgi:hypothetical protein
MKSERLQLVLPAWLKSALREAATNKGVNMSEYIKDLLKESVNQENKPKADDN